MEHGSAEHLGALVAIAAVAAGLVAGARSRGPLWGRRAGRALALAILVAYAVEHLTYAARGDWSTRVNLPLHLTDAVTLVSVAALWAPGRGRLVELVWFWALSASLQAALTPDLGHAFPDVLFLTYFVTHGGAVVAACLLVAGLRRAHRRGAVARAYATTAAFAVAAGVGSLLTGGNYMYLRRKPASGSLLDVMGPWPVYVAVVAVLALVLFALLDVLWRRVAAGRGAAAG